MNTIKSHPVYATLANSAHELFPVEIDDKELEKVMDQEQKDNSILGVRIVAEGTCLIIPNKEHVATITARLRSLLPDTEGCVLQEDFRERVIKNPAYPLIMAEVGKAHEEGRLHELFDEIESCGAVVALDKASGKVTIGISDQAMNFRIKEHMKMHTTRNQRSLDFVNGISPMDLTSSTKRKKDDEPMVGMSTTFYITFQL